MANNIPVDTEDEFFDDDMNLTELGRDLDLEAQKLVRLLLLEFCVKGRRKLKHVQLILHDAAEDVLLNELAGWGMKELLEETETKPNDQDYHAGNCVCIDCQEMWGV